MTKTPRTAFFVLGIIGSLLAGMGALATWRTTDFAGGITTVKGTDLVWGKIALAASALCLIVVLMARVGSTEQPRRWATVVPLPVGLLIVAVGTMAFPVTSSLYGDTLSDKGQKIVTAAGEVLARGRGPLLLLIGGIVLLMASAAGLRWVQEWKSIQEPAGKPDDGPQDEDAPDEGSGGTDPEPEATT